MTNSRGSARKGQPSPLAGAYTPSHSAIRTAEKITSREALASAERTMKLFGQIENKRSK